MNQSKKKRKQCFECSTPYRCEFGEVAGLPRTVKQPSVTFWEQKMNTKLPEHPCKPSLDGVRGIKEQQKNSRICNNSTRLHYTKKDHQIELNVRAIRFPMNEACHIRHLILDELLIENASCMRAVRCEQRCQPEIPW